jgi:hypothetical protein
MEFDIFRCVLIFLEYFGHKLGTSWYGHPSRLLHFVEATPIIFYAIEGGVALIRVFLACFSVLSMDGRRTAGLPSARNLHVRFC